MRVIIDALAKLFHYQKSFKNFWLQETTCFLIDILVRLVYSPVHLILRVYLWIISRQAFISSIPLHPATKFHRTTPDLEFTRPIFAYPEKYQSDIKIILKSIENLLICKNQVMLSVIFLSVLDLSNMPIFLNSITFSEWIGFKYSSILLNFRVAFYFLLTAWSLATENSEVQLELPCYLIKTLSSSNVESLTPSKLVPLQAKSR